MQVYAIGAIFTFYYNLLNQSHRQECANREQPNKWQQVPSISTRKVIRIKGCIQLITTIHKSFKWRNIKSFKWRNIKSSSSDATSSRWSNATSSRQQVTQPKSFNTTHSNKSRHRETHVTKSSSWDACHKVANILGAIGLFSGKSHNNQRNFSKVVSIKTQFMFYCMKVAFISAYHLI